MRISLLRLRVYWKLGLSNAAAVMLYRFRVRSGRFVKQLPISEFGFTHETVLVPNNEKTVDVRATSFPVDYFNARTFQVASPPEWTFDPYTEIKLDNNDQHWSQLSDFALATGDVKVLWELSRFEWLIKVCWQQQHGSAAPNIPINKWLLDWCQVNPANRGVNWKCAQETSIRAMHLVLAWLIQGRQPDNPAVLQFLHVHVLRILPTVSYAKAQDNNHGTSEAAALFVLGIMLRHSENREQATLGAHAERTGRQLLENRVKRLIGPDGTFSQYSVNYHRMMLDTLSFSECIRRRYERPEFSATFYRQAELAACWLYNVTDSVSGDAPNIGANDGSVLFNCNSVDFRDFRPSAQLSTSLFCADAVFLDHQHALSSVFHKELGIAAKHHNAQVTANKDTVFKRLGCAGTYAVLKCPTDRFRPSHADALHLDVWHNGLNIVRDAGTYSYNPTGLFTEDLGTTYNHSTVEIDHRNQMPKLSRFLYGGWLTVHSAETDVSNTDVGVSSAYKDSYGAMHHRSVSKTATGYNIVDQVTGKVQSAVLRWRLAPANWNLQDNKLTSEIASICWSVDQPVKVSITKAKESRHYLELQPVAVLEIHAKSCVTFTTHINFPSP